MRHVDEFIDYAMLPIKEQPENEAYARWVLNYFRHSAVLKSDFAPFMKEHKLFCIYEKEKYRVTGASRLGDIWLTKDFNQDVGYQERVNVDECNNWSKE